jgi:poly(glycerol-phosphate) alpha-glucosyltransferase
MISRLVRLKQIDHAIIAIHQASSSNTNICLDVCGRGGQQERLESLVSDLDLSDRVQLLGHVDDTTDRLHHASFSLVTSKFEGLNLAIIESMAAGCIPIAYDIKYGPSGIITDGVDGYIVPADDPDSLANAITTFLSLSEEEQNVMREAAVERARDFLPDRSYARWKSVLEEPVPLHSPKPFLNEKHLRVREIAMTPGKLSTNVAIVFADKEEIDNKDLRLVVASRKKNTFFQVISTSQGWSRTDGRTTYNFNVPNKHFSQASGQTFDIFVRKYMATWDDKVRVKLPAGFNSTEIHQVKWFRTASGEFSVKVQVND